RESTTAASAAGWKRRFIRQSPGGSKGRPGLGEPGGVACGGWVGMDVARWDGVSFPAAARSVPTRSEPFRSFEHTPGTWPREGVRAVDRVLRRDAARRTGRIAAIAGRADRRVLVLGPIPYHGTDPGAGHGDAVAGARDASGARDPGLATGIC